MLKLTFQGASCAQRISQAVPFLTFLTVLIGSLMAGLFLAGCVSVAEFPTPTGGKGIALRCGDRIERCYQKAAEVCPRGYGILQTNAASDIGPVYLGYHNGVNQYGMDGGTVFTMAIECRA